MKYSLITLTAFLIFLSACATTQKNNHTQQAWNERKNSPEFLREKNLFKERLGNKNLCGTVGIDTFLTNSTSQPSNECLYPTSRYTPTQDQNAVTVGQAVKQLKVFQVTPDGFLVTSPNSPSWEYPSEKLIFVKKTTQSGLIDGSFLDETFGWGIHEYTGTYSYQTALGSKTIYSFKAVPLDAIKTAAKGFKIYNPYQEIFAELGLWEDLEKALQEKSTAK